MKVLNKHIDESGYEYLDPTDLIDEINDPTFKWFSLAKPICEVLNYYQENTPDAFGNAPYARLDGFMTGYFAGKEMEVERGKDFWIVKKGKRKIFAVEVPRKPQSYYEAVKDNIETINAVFG